MVRALSAGITWGADDVASDARKTSAGKMAIIRLDLNADVLAAQESGCDEAAARACERVQNQITDFGESLDNRPECIDRFFGWMAAVSRVMPRQHIANRVVREGWPAFCQQISRFVRITQESLCRGVVLAEHDMAHRRKPSLPPSGKKAIHAIPAIK